MTEIEEGKKGVISIIPSTGPAPGTPLDSLSLALGMEFESFMVTVQAIGAGLLVRLAASWESSSVGYP